MSEKAILFGDETDSIEVLCLSAKADSNLAHFERTSSISRSLTIAVMAAAKFNVRQLVKPTGQWVVLRPVAGGLPQEAVDQACRRAYQHLSISVTAAGPSGPLIVADAWPHLPAPIQDAILALVAAVEEFQSPATPKSAPVIPAIHPGANDQRKRKTP